MYLILMNPADNQKGYLGAVCVINDKPYYVTGIAEPTLFLTEKEAEKMLKKLSKKRPDDTFEIMLLEPYLAIMIPPSYIGSGFGECKWLEQMRKEYGNPE